MKKSILFVVLVGLFSALPVFAQTSIPLSPQPGVSLLGVSCGGIHTSTYVTGFDSKGNIQGDVYAWTRCGGSGRGGGYKSHLYSSWHSIVWDLSGTALQTLPYDGIAPDGTFTATDNDGNMIYNAPVTTVYGPSYVGMLVKP